MSSWRMAVVFKKKSSDGYINRNKDELPRKQLYFSLKAIS